MNPEHPHRPNTVVFFDYEDGQGVQQAEFYSHHNGQRGIFVSFLDGDGKLVARFIYEDIRHIRYL